jgi:hypothetical protein
VSAEPAVSAKEIVRPPEVGAAMAFAMRESVKMGMKSHMLFSF